VSDVKGNGAAVVERDDTSTPCTSERRLVQKTGEFNIISLNVKRRHLKFLTDLFTTLVEMRWRYHVVLFLAPFVVCWLAFAGVYLAIVRAHGDLDNLHNDSWVCCLSDLGTAAIKPGQHRLFG